MSIRREITEYDGVYSPKRRVPEAEESAETESTVNALAKEDLQKPVDQFLAEILLITKFELMLQNTERLMWLLELRRRNETK